LQVCPFYYVIAPHQKIKFNPGSTAELPLPQTCPALPNDPLVEESWRSELRHLQIFIMRYHIIISVAEGREERGETSDGAAVRVAYTIKLYHFLII
jgi:hypothetical protein